MTNYSHVFKFKFNWPRYFRSASLILNTNSVYYTVTYWICRSLELLQILAAVPNFASLYVMLLLVVILG